MSSSATDAMWIDVGMWTGLSGKVQPFTDVECDQPEQELDSDKAWKEWALEHLGEVAVQDSWQPGRYHYTVERRDPSGRAVDTIAQGVWEWKS
ncbi:MAG TPA: hypothetical protein VGM60_07620 [Pseudonocardia sp.]|uniref:hypothetical protein n=1 Tax=Pseudonocardia sp. TaxID=60912 RepID=UPI002F41C59C